MSTDPFLSKRPFTEVAPESAAKYNDEDDDDEVEAPTGGGSSRAPTGTYLDTTISSSYMLVKSFAASLGAGGGIDPPNDEAASPPGLADSIDTSVGTALPEDRTSKLPAVSAATGCFRFFFCRPDDISLPDSNSAASCFSSVLSKTWFTYSSMCDVSYDTTAKVL